jgi:hypothetical protein
VVAGQGAGPRAGGLVLVQGHFDRYKVGRAIAQEKKAVSWKQHEGTTVYQRDHGGHARADQRARSLHAPGWARRQTGGLGRGNGQSNPLSTRLRYVRLDCPSPPTAACFTTRDEQVLAPAVKVLGLKVARTIKLGQGRELEVAGNVFNVFNEGNFTQFNYSGAAEKFNPNFLQPRNQQPARAFQLTGVVRF